MTDGRKVEDTPQEGAFYATQDSHDLHRSPGRGLGDPAPPVVSDDEYAAFIAHQEATPSSPLPLERYVVCAARYNAERFEARLGEEQTGRDWKDSLWFFVRSLKGHPSVAGLPADQAFEQVSTAVHMSRSRDPWLDLGLKSSEGEPMSLEEVQIVFTTTWDKVRVRPGVASLEDAIERADARPLRPENWEGPLYARFVSIAGWLQAARGNRNILLPIDKLAPVLGCHRSMVCRLRQRAERDGLIVKKREAIHRARLADEYRFDVTRFPELQQPAVTAQPDTEQQHSQAPGGKREAEVPPSTPAPRAACVSRDEAARLVAWFFDEWNALAKGLPTLPACRAVTDARRTALRARIAEHGEAGVREILDHVRRSVFLRNESPPSADHPHFRVTVDWVLKPANAAKILEGRYDDAPKPAGEISIRDRWLKEQQRERERRQAEMELTQGKAPATPGELAEINERVDRLLADRASRVDREP